VNENIVLLVEDNPDDVELTLLAFREIGFNHQIVVARDGSEALDYLFCKGVYAGRDRKAAPILILLDLKMPKVGGLEVLRRLRADPDLKHAFVALLTTSTEEKDQAEARTLGSNLYIAKATHYAEFIDISKRVQDLLDARLSPSLAA